MAEEALIAAIDSIVAARILAASIDYARQAQLAAERLTRG